MLGATCYAHRHPDLLRSFCGGSLEACDVVALRTHFERSQPVEGGVLVRREGGECGAGVGVVAEQQAGLVELRYGSRLYGGGGRAGQCLSAGQFASAGQRAGQFAFRQEGARNLFVSC